MKKHFVHMQKHRFKTHLKLVILLFGVSMSYLSCQKDDDLSKDTTNSQLEFKRDLITKSQISNNKKVNSIIQTLPKTNTLLTNNFNTQARTVYNEEYDFYINDEKAYHITYGNYDSYTFAIHRSQDNGLIENLILSKQLDGSYKSSIVSYNLNETEKQSIKNGTIPSGIENKMSIQPLSRGTDARIIQIGSSGIYYQEGSDGCIKPTFTNIDTPDGPASAFSGWIPAGCPQGFVTSIDTGADNGSDAGGSVTPNLPSYTNPGTPNTGNPSGSPSGGGNGTPNTTGNSNNTGSDNSNGSGQEGSQDCIQVGVDGGCIVEIITPLVLDYDDTIIDCIGYSSEITQLTLSQKSDLANFINTNGCTEENSAIANVIIDFYSEEDWKQLLRDAVASGVTSTAELTHRIYKKLSIITQTYPSSIVYINSIVNEFREIAGEAFDTDTQTLDWLDLFGIWLFELGNYPQDTITFDGNDNTTISLKQQEGVNEARQIAIDKINSNDLSDPTVSNPWVYGQTEFYDGMTNSNIATSFLGSYGTNIAITQNPNGSYTLTFSVSNPSTWESATRLRIDNDGDGNHDRIFPNKNRGDGIPLGGTINQIWIWTEIVN
ncbi:hypothetical protein [Lacinutrix undariae]